MPKRAYDDAIINYRKKLRSADTSPPRPDTPGSGEEQRSSRRPKLRTKCIGPEQSSETVAFLLARSEISCHPPPPEDLSLSTWVAASRVRNHVMNDPILDWLAMYDTNNGEPHHSAPQQQNISNVNNSNISNNNLNKLQAESFHQFIMNKGVEFEQKVIQAYRNVFAGCVVTIADITEAHSEAKFKQTIAAMEQGVPIIYQGVLRDYETETYGMPDLLVRSDYIKEIAVIPALEPKYERIAAPRFTHGKHYLIVDIKHSTLCLTADGRRILNTKSIPAYKAQLYIYHRALTKIQGYEPRYAFIVGRRWKYTTCGKEYSGWCANDRLGIIDYQGFDAQYVSRTNNAVEWLKRLRNEGHEWSVSPPTIAELYPNMCNQYDGRLHERKCEIAKELEEITLVWNCGVRNRQHAHNVGVYKYTDEKCSPETLGFMPHDSRTTILARILEVNRGDQLVIPNKIYNNKHNWRQEYPVEYFVDFEALNDIGFEPDIEEPAIDCVFMIGVGRLIDGCWSYHNYIVKNISEEEERRIFREFTAIIEPGAPIFTWGDFERQRYSKARAKYNIRHALTDNRWINFIEVLKSEPVAIKGALNYGLKSIAPALHNHGLISTVWPENSICKNGLDAMVTAWKCSRECDNMQVHPLMQDITAYNIIDCKVVQEIVEYFRANH